MEPPPAPAYRACIAARLVLSVERCFPHPFPLGHADGGAVRTLFDDAIAAETRQAFVRACRRYLASLENGHTGFSDDHAPSPRIGFHARPLDGHWIVTRSRRPDLRAGDLLDGLDGVPMAALCDRLSPIVSASRPASAQASLLFQTALLPEGAWALADGRAVPFAHEGPNGLPPAPPAASLETAANGTAVLRLPDCAPATTRRAVALLDATSDIRALILDLRGNGGGDTPFELIRRLVRGRWRLWTDASILADGLALAEGCRERALIHRPSPWCEGDEAAFDGPVAVLTDPLTASAAEDLILPLREGARAAPAVIVGETTAGTTGQPFHETLGDGLSYRVAAKRCIHPSGAPFEGVGFAPDVAAPPTREGLSAGRDEALEAARSALADDAR